jgi:hypothetical protein
MNATCRSDATAEAAPLYRPSLSSRRILLACLPLLKSIRMSGVSLPTGRRGVRICL